MGVSYEVLLFITARDCLPTIIYIFLTFIKYLSRLSANNFPNIRNHEMRNCPQRSIIFCSLNLFASPLAHIFCKNIAVFSYDLLKIIAYFVKVLLYADMRYSIDIGTSTLENH